MLSPSSLPTERRTGRHCAPVSMSAVIAERAQEVRMPRVVFAATIAIASARIGAHGVLNGPAFTRNLDGWKEVAR